MPSTAEILERAAVPQSQFTQEQIESTIKSLHNWITAISAGTFRGHETFHIATLLDFLRNQQRQATEDCKKFYPDAAVLKVNV